MTYINSQGELIQKSFLGKDIPIQGVLFNERVYASKCQHYVLYGGITVDHIIDNTLHFSTI